VTRVFTDKETVDWMLHLDKRMSSAAAALYDKTGRVLVVKAHYKHYWSFPGGVVDAGETPRLAAVRETAEEVGLLVDADALKFVIIVDRVSPIAQTYQLIFEQEVASELLDTVVLDDDEIEDWTLVTREQIIAGDRYYSETTVEWAKGFTGYMEQQFGPGMQGDI
jgi:8-oxo-dGTP pyrophosphatase MutT (NUDIX family)